MWPVKQRLSINSAEDGDQCHEREPRSEMEQGVEDSQLRHMRQPGWNLKGGNDGWIAHETTGDRQTGNAAGRHTVGVGQAGTLRSWQKMSLPTAVRRTRGRSGLEMTSTW